MPNENKQPELWHILIAGLFVTVVGGLTLDWIREARRERRELEREDG